MSNQLSTKPPRDGGSPTPQTYLDDSPASKSFALRYQASYLPGTLGLPGPLCSYSAALVLLLPAPGASPGEIYAFH